MELIPVRKLSYREFRAITKTVQIMKLTVLLLLTACLQVGAHGYSQGKITISIKDENLDKVLKEITKQSGYYFWSGSNLPELSQKVEVHIKDATIQEAMTQCLKGSSLTYTISDKMVFIKKAEPVEEPGKHEEMVGNGIDVKGKVMNESGEPLPGATIMIKGTKIVISANDKGEFVLKGVDPAATVIISSVGYEPQTLHFGGRSTFIFALKQKVGVLDETHVIAYGKTTQRYSVGSISKVTADDIASQPVSNPLAALEGRVPGMVVTQSSGVPGAAFTVQIRGQNTLGQPGPAGGYLLDQPLFIIDGVPFAPQNGNINQFSSLGAPGGPTYFGSGGGLSPFNSINPLDIENIEVLRDADATAIYGSRGANGVILITTKSGKAGKAKFNSNVYTGEDRVTRSTPMLDTKQYLQMRFEAYKNDASTGYTPTPSYDPDLLVYDTTKNTNWRNQFLGGIAHSTDANTSLSGGSENTQFLIGAGYHYETYITPGDFADARGSVNVNLRHRSTDQRLSIDFSTSYSYDRNNSSGSPSALLAFTLPPDFPSLLNRDGSLVWKYNGYDLGDIRVSNPFAYLKQKYVAQNYNLNSHFQIGYKILPGLIIQSSFGYNTFNGNETSIIPLASLNPATNPQSSAQYGTNNFGTWIIEPQVTYRKIIGKGSINFLLGSTFEKNGNSSLSITGFNYPNDALLGSINSAGASYPSNSSSLYKYNAIFGRLNYNYKSRYIVDLNARRDGSSKFGPGNQFGDFGSVGGGWIFSEESLVKEKFSFLSFGKLRGSYGTSGGDHVGEYQYLSRWAPIAGQPYQNQIGYAPQNLFNPNYHWDVNKKLEFGFDFGVLKDRILSSITWFRNRCGNQLVSYPLPEQAGFAGVIQNAPYLVQNSGWEIQINTVDVRSKNFAWRTAFNLTIPYNKLLSFPGLSSSPYAYQYVVGKSLSTHLGYHLLGVNDTTGVFQFATSKGSPTYTPTQPTGTSFGDWRTIGDFDPKFYGGLRNIFVYGAFQLDIFTQFTKQLGQSYLGQIYSYNSPGATGNQPIGVLSRWQNPGDKSGVEKFTEAASTPAYQARQYFTTSDGAFSDASFIRIKTVSFSYNVPSNYLRKLKVEGCRFYFNIQNLFTITGYKGNDPESQSLYGIPPLKTIVIGLNFTL